MAEENILPAGQADSIQLVEDKDIIIYYAGEGFYRSDSIETAYANGFTDDDLTVISHEDYDAWFNPPAGKYGAWVDGKPVLLDVPPPDYPTINGIEAQRLKDSAMATIQVLIVKLNMGRTLTAAEKAKVNAVLDYCDAVDEVDLTVANPTWPELPKT